MPEPEEADIDQILARADTEIASCDNRHQLEAVRSAYLGKKGILTILLKQVGALPTSQRPLFGHRINSAKNTLLAALTRHSTRLENTRLSHALAKEQIDVTLPGRGLSGGGIHPITSSMQRIEEIFVSMGFSIATGPEVEDDFHNFTALNIPPEHPARAMHDTFYLQDDRHLLRTHTSPVQVRYLREHSPPVNIIAPGRVYRRDSDITHTPMFHQVEGLMVDEGISFADLKGVLTLFLRQYFEAELKLRFRPSYFPFTEPSAEVDINCIFCQGRGCRVCSHSGWLEVLGSGMVHPHVFDVVEIDTQKYTGFAFGLGVERLAMLRYGINDIRLFFENDLTFLEQFK